MVNETNGNIKTAGKLDRESNSSLTFVIIVRISIRRDHSNSFMVLNFS